jgi:hypothetical protein
MKRTLRTVPLIRSVKPELFRHEGLFDAEIDYQLPLRLAFIALITCCDREGRFRWQLRRLKADMLPFDNVDLTQILDALITRGFIMKYEYQGEWYGCIPSWLRHQSINNRERASIFPGPDGFAVVKKKNASLKSPRVINAQYKSVDESDKKKALEGEYDKNVATASSKIVKLKQSESLNSKQAAKNFTKNNTITLDSNSVLHESVTCEPRVVNIPEWNGMEWNGMEWNGTEDNTIVASPMRLRVENKTIQQIFEHWKTVMRHPSAKLDPKRKALIVKALHFGYGTQELCEAISGCSITPHNIGQNDRNQRYDGLHIILRDADQIDRFIHHYHYPPQPLSAAEKRTQANVETLKRWANKKMTEEKIHAS